MVGSAFHAAGGPGEADAGGAERDEVVREVQPAADVFDGELERHERALQDGGVGVVGVDLAGEAQRHVAFGLGGGDEGQAVDRGERAAHVDAHAVVRHLDDRRAVRHGAVTAELDAVEGLSGHVGDDDGPGDPVGAGREDDDPGGPGPRGEDGLLDGVGVVVLPVGQRAELLRRDDVRRVRVFSVSYTHL